MVLRLFIILCLCALPSLAAAIDVPLRIDTENNVETLTLTLPVSVPAKVFTLGNPPRVVLDIPSTQKLEAHLSRNYSGALIATIRSGQFNPTTSRIVIEAKTLGGITTSQAGEVLTVTLQPGKTLAKTAEKSKEKPPEKPLVVLDPGHGGQDPGTTGKRGTEEKDVVLRYAKALKASLDKSGKYRVMLTRDADYFIRLRERFKQARDAKATIFISMHADSSHDSARGLSVYTLSETASDKEAEDLAARENRSDVIAGMDLSTHDEDVANILISLAQRETNTNSATLADSLVAGMEEHNVRLLENTHRFAGFAVLKAPDVPSVLVEIGFLSHPEEEKRLNSESYRNQIVSGLEAGINRYFDTQKKLHP